MKFAKFGIFASLASLASALSLGPINGNYQGGSQIEVPCSLGDNQPGSYAFTLCQDGVFVELLEVVDILVDGVVSLLLPGGLLGGGYQIYCCPEDDYNNPYDQTNYFTCDAQ